jgi:hypothetical protein
MSAVFKAAIPSTQKLVLLAVADCANDMGECYPSVPLLMAKSSLSERAVQGALKWLEKAGWLVRECRTGRSTVYRVTPAADAPPQQMPPAPRAPTPAPRAPLPPQDVHPTPAPRAPITIREPSIEPSPKRKTPAPPDVSPSVWADWVLLRREKKSPVTETALNGIRREAGKAGISLDAALTMCCERGWAGFRADWAKAGGQVATVSKHAADPPWLQAQADRVAQFAGRAATKPAGKPALEVIDGIARILG